MDKYANIIIPLFIHSFKDLYSTSSRKLLPTPARSKRTAFNWL